MALHPLHRNAIFFRSEVEASVRFTKARGHVRTAAVVERGPAETGLASRGTLDLGKSTVPVLLKVVSRVELGDPPSAIHVAGGEGELVGFGDVPRK